MALWRREVPLSVPRHAAPTQAASPMTFQANEAIAGKSRFPGHSIRVVREKLEHHWAVQTAALALSKRRGWVCDRRQFLTNHRKTRLVVRTFQPPIGFTAEIRDNENIPMSARKSSVGGGRFRVPQREIKPWHFAESLEGRSEV
jgi:hypothetical protein